MKKNSIKVNFGSSILAPEEARLHLPSYATSGVAEIQLQLHVGLMQAGKTPVKFLYFF